MTPTEQDKELREQVSTVMYDTDYKHVIEDPEYFDKAAVDAVVDLITADRKRVALEARINERNKIALDNYRGKTASESTNWQGEFEYFMEGNEERIAELKAQQEEV